MKKILFIAIVMLSLGTITAKADRDYVITKKELPAKAQQFIDTHFAKSKISYVKEERDFFERNYEIVFADGAKVEFNGNGEWREIDCRYTELPAAAIPAAIKSYANEHFPDAKMLKIDRERKGYELKLSNKLELTFDKNFKIKDIED